MKLNVSKILVGKRGSYSVSRIGIVTEGYAEYGIKVVKKGNCTECGKVRQCTVEFTQFVSLFNRNKNGEIKTIAQIMEEEKVKANKYVEQPHICNQCRRELR